MTASQTPIVRNNGEIYKQLNTLCVGERCYRTPWKLVEGACIINEKVQID